jgi:drug/metabolite transporter (DMT)-like permease
MEIEGVKTRLSDEIRETTETITFVDILTFIVLAVFCVIGAYYGWVYGVRQAPYYLAVLQSIGFTIKTYIMRLVSYTQEYARRSR